jgi:alpha-L-rhamnosidase
MKILMITTVGLHLGNMVMAGDITPERLSCEYREYPLGIDVAKPRLSWVIGAHSDKGTEAQSGRGIKQKAYQILVASTPEILAKDQGDLWDSGKVESDQQNQIEYAGKKLESRMHCYWKVRIWTLTSGLRAPTSAPSDWSKPASWTMGFLDQADWKGKWIGVDELDSEAPVKVEALKIISASYQSVSGTPARDVIELLKQSVKDNKLNINVSNESMGGDVASGTKKRLVVDYELAGKSQQQIVNEGESLAINTKSTAQWAKPRYLRKPFTVGSPVRRATVYTTALGLYELRLNGQRVGDQPLAPEWTNYHKRVQVQTYDVTAQVRAGQNVLAATLGNGWYCGGWQNWKYKLMSMYGTEPYFFAQLEIECADGTRQQVVTDATWRGTVDGPLRFAGIYEGSTYDATKELPGWDRPDYNDAAWAPAQPAPADLKVGQLVWQRNEPIRRTREIKPVAVNEVKPGVYVFAFDQNIVGWTRFSFRGQPGQTVELQHGEMRNLDGTVFLGNLLVVSKHQIQLDRYTFRTDQVETHEPSFTYHGFQYVEVRGLTAKPDLESLTGVIANSDCPEVGQFTCSEPLLNRLAENILWSQRGNFQGVPTDCPQRNERCGYTGDANFFMRAAVFNMDVGAFFNKWLVDVCEDAQMPQGYFTDHAPRTCAAGDNPNVGWSDAGIICPFEIYRTYGDTRVIRDHYAAMKRKLDYLTRNSTDGLFTGKIGNGDWLSNQGGVDKQVMGTAYAAFNFKQMAEMAAAIGETADAAAFRSQAEKISTAFAAAYIDADGRIKNSSQSGYALAFTMGLVPESRKAAMSARFAEEMQKFEFHPRTGFVGTPRLLPGLHEAGQDDAAYKTLLTKTAPSWLYPVTVGATTIWEQWVGWDGENPKGGMNSLNHYSFGAVGEYLYGMVGGIQPDAPGYQKIKIAPVIREGLTWANTRYDSIRGRIVSNWKREGDKLTMAVTIPANTTATIYVPTKDASSITESGQPVSNVPQVKFLRQEAGAVVYTVDAGTYQFSSTMPETIR